MYELNFCCNGTPGSPVHIGCAADSGCRHSHKIHEDNTLPSLMDPSFHIVRTDGSTHSHPAHRVFSGQTLVRADDGGGVDERADLGDDNYGRGADQGDLLFTETCGN